MFTLCFRFSLFQFTFYFVLLNLDFILHCNLNFPCVNHCSLCVCMKILLSSTSWVDCTYWFSRLVMTYCVVIDFLCQPHMSHADSQIPIPLLFLLLSSYGVNLKVVKFFFFWFVFCLFVFVIWFLIFDFMFYLWHLDSLVLEIVSSFNFFVGLIFVIEFLYGLSNVTSHILFLLLTIKFIALDFGVSFGVWSLITNQVHNASIEDTWN